MLDIRGVSKRFGSFVAVDGIDLIVEGGSLVALLGPSGCGKTTTLRMISGLEQPTGGDIRFDGVSMLGISPHKRNIGMVFQRYVLFPHMSVAANIGFGLRMRRRPKAEIARRVAEVIKVVQLAGMEQRFPSQLSGGQQQRVAIARTVITDPRLMLMDEPLSNLDAKLREEMRSFITTLQRRLKVTTLFVTHDQTEAIELADRVGVMFAGRIMQFGTPAEVFNQPLTPRIAEFMGATNFIEGQLEDSGRGQRLLKVADARLSIGQGAIQQRANKQGASGQKGSAHALGPALATIRPEHIDILDRGTDGANILSAKVLQSVYYGGTVGYSVQVGATKLSIRDRSGRLVEPGSEVAIRLPAEHLWLFPEQDSLETERPETDSGDE